MLFKNIDTDKNIGATSFVEHFTGINHNMFTPKIRPAIRQAVDLNILNWISESFYNSLESKYKESIGGVNIVFTENENLVLNGINLIFNPENSRILRSLQDAIAHYAIVKKMDEGGANLSELGLHYRNDGDGTTQQVPQWQFFAAKYDITKKADAFFERFLDFVYKNMNNFSTFSVDIETFFINTPRQLSQHLAIENGLMTFVNMLPSMRKTARTYIKPHLGKDLYNLLLKKSRDGKCVGDYYELWELVCAYLAPKSLIAAIPFLNVDLSDGKLFTVSTSDGYRNRSQASEAAINRLITQLEKESQSAENELLIFLAENGDTFGISTEYEPRQRIIVTEKSVGLF